MSATPADTVLVNGTISPLASTDYTTDALAISDGKVLSLGDAARASIGPGTELIDLKGRFVLPGLLDVHNHHLLAGQMELFELVFSPTLGLDEILNRVRAYAESLDPDAWITGGSWGSGLIAELDSVAARRKLDEAAGYRPVLLKDDSKHNRWASTAALKAAGIDEETPNPIGGQIRRSSEGEATGVLLEAGGVLVERALQRIAPSSTAELAAASLNGIQVLHSYGITGFQDAATSLQLMRALHNLDVAGKLRCWVISSMQANDFIFGTEPLGEDIIAQREATRSEHHRPDFIKIFLDGVPPAGTAAFLEPYVETAGFPPCHHGETTMPMDELENWLLSTAQRGISAKIHCTGDASVRMVLNAVTAVRAAGYDDVHYHIAHGQFVHETDIPRFAELNVTADISPALWFPGVIPDAIDAVLPHGRGSRIQPNRSLLDAGARIAAGSDWPVAESPNPWAAISSLMTRQDPSGQRPGALWPEQAVTRNEALRAHTSAAAEAMGLADIAGKLAPGHSADLIVLPEDPMSMPPADLADIEVDETWFAGAPVYVAAGGAS